MFTHSRRIPAFVTAAALAAAVIGAGTSPAFANDTHGEHETHHYHGRGSISGHLDFGSPTVTLTGHGWATYQGRTTIVNTIDPADSIVDVTSANGDVLHNVVTGSLPATDVVCPSGALPGRIESAIVGGTGRFADASGTVVVTDCAILSSVTATGATLTVTLSVDGTISF